MKRSPLWLAFLVLLGAVAIPKAVSAATGTIELRVTDHKPGIDQFSRLGVEIKSIALHAKGKPRKSGWIELAKRVPDIDIVPLKDGVFKSLGQRQLALGTYDAIRIRFGKVSGDLKRGGDPTVNGKDTVVATDIRVAASGNKAIVIDLFAEDQTEHDPPIYVVKVKEVRLEK